jgi:hypothetical protein
MIAANMPNKGPRTSRALPATISQPASDAKENVLIESFSPLVA